MSYTFITGATSGIGLETAKQLAQKKHPLILNGRRKDRLEILKKELSAHTEIVIAPFDVSAPREVDAWLDQNQKIVSEVSVLINNAGLARGTSSLQTSQWEDWEEMIDTNLKGLLYLTRKLIDSLITHKGHIINLGSVAGRWSYGGGSVYCATKFAVRALSESFRIDLAGTGVRITNIEPGLVETEFSEVRLRDKDKANDVYKGMTPLKPKDIAETICWSLDRPNHVNIQEMVVFPTDQASTRDVFRQLP